MLQNLLSNPGVVSVESLERAHREESRSPQAEMPPMPLQATKADDLEADLKNKLQVRLVFTLKSIDQFRYSWPKNMIFFSGIVKQVRPSNDEKLFS